MLNPQCLVRPREAAAIKARLSQLKPNKEGTGFLMIIIDSWYSMWDVDLTPEAAEAFVSRELTISEGSSPKVHPSKWADQVTVSFADYVFDDPMDS